MIWFFIADKSFEIVSNQERKWCKLFADFIVGNAYCSSKNCAAHSDDMLWYVPVRQINQDFYIGQGVPVLLDFSLC